MPRIPRDRTTSRHAPSATKRPFAAQHVSETIIPGTATDDDEDVQPVGDYLRHEFPEPRTKSKPQSAKAAMRRAALEKQAQESAPLPYAISKSAMRRRKRQARAALAGEGVSALEEALDTIDEPEEPISETVERATKVEAVKKEAKITATKRAKYLSDESKRLPAILKDASFRKDPFAAIRLHAQNTLAQRTPPKKRRAQKQLAPTDDTIMTI